MKIFVKQQYIDAGMKFNSYSCPIALAVKAKLGFRPTSNGVFVGRNYIDVRRGLHKGKRTVLKINEFIWKFDHGIVVKPFEFTLHL